MVTPQQASRVGFCGKYHPLLGAAIHHSVLFLRHVGGYLVAEAHVGGIEFAGLVTPGAVAHHAVAHGLAVDSLVVGTQSHGLAHHRLVGAPHGTTRLGIDASEGTLGVGYEDAASRLHRPYRSRAVVHVVPIDAAPLPFERPILQAQAVEVHIPGAEHHMPVGHKRPRLDVALYTRIGPAHLARAHIQCPHAMVAAAHIGDTVSDGHRTQHRGIGLHLPHLVPAAFLQAINAAVGTGYHENTLAGSGCAYDAGTRLEAPQALAVPEAIGRHAAGIIAHKHALALDGRR